MKRLIRISFFLLIVISESVYSQQSNLTDSTVADIDGNVYPVVQIGNQIWMAENLRTTRYSDGTPVEYSMGSSEIASDDTTKRYFYYNDNPANSNRYGCLYTWYAAVRGVKGNSANPSQIQGIAPTGWHIPSVAEWRELESYLGENAADQLKSRGDTGFNSQYGGCGGDLTKFQQMYETGFYLTANSGEEYSTDPFDHIILALIRTYDHEIIFGGHTKTCGYSVRCIKDQTSTGLNTNDLTKFPSHFTLFPNYPNPFNPSTTIRYSLPKAGWISLEIYNLLGQKIETLVDEYQTAGGHQVRWKPDGLSSGIYVVRIRAGSQIKTMKLVLQR